MTDATDLRTYIVNLPRRADRRERMRHVLPSELNATFTCQWEGPFDGRGLRRADLERAGYRLFDWQIESENPWWSRPLKLGEVGCALSHLACWRDATTRIEPYILVLEDDAVLEPSFMSDLLCGLDRLTERPFDLLYLGRFPLEPDRADQPGFVVPGYSHCSYGYLLTAHGVRLLMAAGLGQAIIPVDEFLPAMYLDHPRPDVRACFPQRLTALAFDPPIVWQLPKDVAGSDTEDSTFVEPPTTPANAE